MDIEQLTKTQIVLLTLLVSFMTSIATGIVTVTLLDQAPPAVTQTINRVVERTVERVIPDKTQVAGVVTTETTVVVKESDLITESIDANAKYLVRIFRKANPTIVDSKDEFVAIGTLISDNGIVATDGAVILDGFDHLLIMSSGEVFDAVLAKRDVDNRIVLLALKPKTLAADGSAEKLETGFAEFGDLSVLKLGMTVIAFSGTDRTNVAVGIIAGLDTTTVTIPAEEAEKERDEPTTSEVLTRIKTDISAVDISPGSPLINIFGEVIGVYTTAGQRSGGASYTPISVVESIRAAFSEKSTLIDTN